MTKYFILGFILAAIAPGISSCNGTKSVTTMPDDGTEIPLTVLDRGAYCAYPDSGQVRISDSEAFALLWRNMHQNQTPMPEMPAINFQTQEVIAAFMGSRPSGGYSVSVARGLSSGNAAWIEIIHDMPGEGCMTTSAITHPYALVQVEKSNIAGNKEVHFVIQNRVNDCTN